MLSLYEFGPTRSARVKWLVDILKIEVKLIDAFSEGLMKTEEYKTKHPLSKVPALETDEGVIFESVAIVTYLADKYGDEKIIPAVGTFKKAEYDKWCLFALCELEAFLWNELRYYQHESNLERADLALGVFDDLLSERQYILGDHLSAADLNVSYTLNWARNMKLITNYKNIDRYILALFDQENCPLVDKTKE